MELLRTTHIKIDLDINIARRTVTEWVRVCNFISQIAFSNGCISNAVKLSKLVYEKVRTRFNLSAQITQSVRKFSSLLRKPPINHVASKYASLRTQKKQPQKPVHFKENSAVVLQGGSRGRDFSFVKSGMSVWTTSGRIKPLPSASLILRKLRTTLSVFSEEYTTNLFGIQEL